jgi:hypothetical protein
VTLLILADVPEGDEANRPAAPKDAPMSPQDAAAPAVVVPVANTAPPPAAGAAHLPAAVSVPPLSAAPRGTSRRDG